MNLRSLRPFAWLMVVSAAILIVGIGVMGVGLLMQEPVLQLVGMMAIVAGAVKVGVVLIWTRIAGLGRDDYSPTPAP